MWLRCYSTHAQIQLVKEGSPSQSLRLRTCFYAAMATKRQALDGVEAKQCAASLELLDGITFM